MLKVTVNKQYDIIANLCTNDGLLIGAHYCIIYIQHEHSKSSIPSIIWVQFEDLNIGKQHRQKYKLYVQHKRDVL